MPNAIAVIQGRGVPLMGDDIDTDQILESRYLKLTTFQGMEAHLFESVRRQAREAGALHPLDDPRYAGANILIVNRNFGCGSSREHAPQALRRFGLQAIVGVSFGGIFAGNCLSIGLPCVSVSPEDASWLQTHCTKQPGAEIRVDIDACRLTVDGMVMALDLPEGRRQRLLDGTWNMLDVLLRQQAQVDAYLAGRG